MQFFVTSRSAARFIFIIGFLFMFLGTAFLLGSLMGISKASVFISFLLVILGIGFAAFAIKLNRRSLYLFLAALFLQAGLFLFLYSMKIIPLKFSQMWPLLSVFSGLALFPAGWHSYGIFKANYIVPSVAFVILGAGLMVFALNIVPFSFVQFVKNWWPLLVVLAGLTMILVSLGTRLPGNRKQQ
jgi:hypothetical protein